MILCRRYGVFVVSDEIHCDFAFPEHPHHVFKEDLALFAEMGFKVPRVSIAWTRLYPTGEELEPNPKGVAFYKGLFQEMRRLNIEPLVTLHHYEMPLSLSLKYNGWTDRRVVELFLRFARTCFEEYGEYVKYWLTFNEIDSIRSRRAFAWRLRVSRNKARSGERERRETAWLSKRCSIPA